MKIFEILSEALKPSEYREFVKGWDKSKYEDIFDGKYRIYIPLSNVGIVKPDPDVEKEVKTAGYEIEDYIAGIAKKGLRSIKIGKLLKDPIVIKKFVNDLKRSASKTKQEVVISRHPYDIAGMSTNRGWRSCMNLEDGKHKKYVPIDVKEGTLIAYLINTDDKNINHPIARLLIKPFVNIINKKEFVLGIENRIYGTGSPEFRKTVLDWADKINERKKLNGVFDLKKGLYSDNELGIPGHHIPSSRPSKVIGNLNDLDEISKIKLIRKGELTLSSIKNPSIELIKDAIKADLKNNSIVPGNMETLNTLSKSDISKIIESFPKVVLFYKNSTESMWKSAVNKDAFLLSRYLRWCKDHNIVPAETTIINAVKREPQSLNAVGVYDENISDKIRNIAELSKKDMAEKYGPKWWTTKEIKKRRI